VLPGLDEEELSGALRDRSKRFVWVRRGLSADTAQKVHDLGLPGLAFRTEPRRSYPLGRIAGHVLGAVNIDNKGIAGIERHIDATAGIESVLAAHRSERAPVRLTLDIRVQHALEEELAAAMKRYGARAAAGVLLEAGTGAVVGAASLPDVDPARPAEALEPERIDRLASGTYELGSILKLMTVAMALDGGRAKLDTPYDVREPLTVGRFTIRDLHPAGRPLSLAEVFVLSSNVGAGMMALEAGSEGQRGFLGRLGLTATMTADALPIAPPQLPAHWDRAETITIAYGHGLALAPLQFAAAAASLVNGGTAVRPTFLVRDPDRLAPASGERVIAAETSARVRDLMRLNVTHASGTGRRADVAGYEVGGKTGTAELPGRGGYRETSVISSFVAAFPMQAPRHVLLVLLFEPSPTEETRSRITAGHNAAPTAGRIIARTAPLL
jgi:cell division protein FtsI (penicillin-binding protein 3)